jgi:lysophospholipase L1-like esterase
MEMVVLYFSLATNLALVTFMIVLAHKYREEIIQKVIYRKHAADIVMFGDSYTEGGDWNLLLDHFKYKILNMGYGGFTSDQLAWYTIKKTLQFNPRFVFILCGGNDIEARCFSIDDVLQNFMTITQVLKSKNITPVFQKLFYQYNNPQFNSIIDSINQRLVNFCNEERIDCLDITEGMNDESGLKKSLTTDGCHLNKEGYKIWSKILNDYLKDKI